MVFAFLVVGCEWVRIGSRGGQMFSSEVRGDGEAARGADHGLKTALGTVLGFFGLASLCTRARVTHLCPDAPAP